MATLPSGESIAQAVMARHREIAERIHDVEEAYLLQPSRLPGWDRLTVLCHLRYGAVASRQITQATLDGRAAAFYPKGRQHQRPETLQRSNGESVIAVAASLDVESQSLDETWACIGDDQWRLTIHEPSDNVDLGPITLWTLALLRLTEVEVHGHDLDLGLSPWSATFVESCSPDATGMAADPEIKSPTGRSIDRCDLGAH